jgi:hypothetical protein
VLLLYGLLFDRLLFKLLLLQGSGCSDAVLTVLC